MAPDLFCLLLLWLLSLCWLEHLILARRRARKKEEKRLSMSPLILYGQFLESCLPSMCPLRCLPSMCSLVVYDRFPEISLPSMCPESSLLSMCPLVLYSQIPESSLLSMCPQSLLLSMCPLIPCSVRSISRKLVTNYVSTLADF